MEDNMALMFCMRKMVSRHALVCKLLRRLWALLSLHRILSRRRRSFFRGTLCGMALPRRSRR